MKAYKTCVRCGANLDAGEKCDCALRILDGCAAEGMDLDQVLRVKHKYNKRRPYQNGGKAI